MGVDVVSYRLVCLLAKSIESKSPFSQHLPLTIGYDPKSNCCVSYLSSITSFSPSIFTNLQIYIFFLMTGCFSTLPICCGCCIYLYLTLVQHLLRLIITVFLTLPGTDVRCVNGIVPMYFQHFLSFRL